MDEELIYRAGTAIPIGRPLPGGGVAWFTNATREEIAAYWRAARG